MEILATLGIFLAGLGVLLIGSGFIWWCAMYEEIHLKKHKKEIKL
jgi:hypothetical protein